MSSIKMCVYMRMEKFIISYQKRALKSIESESGNFFFHRVHGNGEYKKEVPPQCRRGGIHIKISASPFSSSFPPPPLPHFVVSRPHKQ
jgi:hypothetical protein